MSVDEIVSIFHSRSFRENLDVGGKINTYNLLICWIDKLYTQSVGYFTIIARTLPLYIKNHVSIIG